MDLWFRDGRSLGGYLGSRTDKAQGRAVFREPSPNHAMLASACFVASVINSCTGRRLSQPGEQPHTAGRPCRPVASRGQIVDTSEFITGLIIIILIYLIATIVAFWRGTRTAG
jgi:hypothetical protein